MFLKYNSSSAMCADNMIIDKYNTCNKNYLSNYLLCRNFGKSIFFV